jgi:hypothetical protein
LRPTIGNLAEFDYDVRRALSSQAMEAEIAAIPEANCWCTHSCFIQDSSKFSARVQLFEIPWAWFRQRMDSLGDLPPEEIRRFKALELA